MAQVQGIETRTGPRRRVGEGIQVTFPSGLLFDFDSDVVRSDAATNLNSLAANLNNYGDSNMMIAGHTDAVGSSEYNQGLSNRRAESAARYLSTQGVSRHIATAGLGEREPVGSNETEAGRQQNRRIEVAIYASAALQEDARREAAGRCAGRPTGTTAMRRGGRVDEINVWWKRCPESATARRHHATTDKGGGPAGSGRRTGRDQVYPHVTAETSFSLRASAGDRRWSEHRARSRIAPRATAGTFAGDTVISRNRPCWAIAIRHSTNSTPRVAR